MNKLLFGDNLKWLRNREIFPDASVDLVYLDPPFKSDANYNVLFKEDSGLVSQAQFHAFTDTWNWADAAQTYAEFVDTCENNAVVEMVEALHSFLKNSPMMAYLAMMAPRLVELRRILKPTGSLYLHCDPTASHYLRMILDGIFGAENFRNEIIWKRADTVKGNFGQGSKFFDRNTDTIFFYAKSDQSFFNPLFNPYSEEYLENFYKYIEPGSGRRYRLISMTGPGGAAKGNPQYEVLGITRYWRYSKKTMQELIDKGMVVQGKPGLVPQRKQYLDEGKGVPVQSLWDDISALHSQSGERQGYPTQKPQALLERIIKASCPENGLVCDPFCGCGTTVHAAQKLDRQWIGIDVTYIAINLIKTRLADAFGTRLEYEEKGQPTDFESAKALAELPGDGKFQFQQWALSLIKARPLREGDGKGADRGVDGMLYFYESENAREKILVQVKGGGVKRSDVATLIGDVNNQKFIGGVLITLEKPTKPMREEAADAGRFKSKRWQKDYPKIQLLTIEGILNGTERLDAPPQGNPFAKAEIDAGKQPEQQHLV